MLGRLWQICSDNCPPDNPCKEEERQALIASWDKNESRRGQCLHLGEPIGEQKCETCPGNVRLKIFACALHQKCTPQKQLAGVTCCAACPDFAATPAAKEDR
jgi:hypothetical protein